MDDQAPDRSPEPDVSERESAASVPGPVDGGGPDLDRTGETAPPGEVAPLTDAGRQPPPPWVVRPLEALDAVAEDAVRCAVERDLSELRRVELLQALVAAPLRPEKVHVLGDEEVAGEWWFVGDVHGDLVALETVLSRIDAMPPTGARHIVFLGDLVDDGPHGLEVFLRVADLAVAGGMDVRVLAGNHDEAVRFSGGSFRSEVDPGDFARFLELNRADAFVQAAGEAFVSIFAAAPRALFFPDGLFVAHAGFPLADLHPGLSSREDLESTACLQDFVWTRAGSTRRKIPNRSTRGCQFGVQDLEAFCLVAERILGRPVRSLLRAHDHAEERFDVHSRYNSSRLLTLNTMSHRLPRETFGPWVRPVVAANYIPSGDVEVFRWQVSESLVNQFYPEPLEG